MFAKTFVALLTQPAIAVALGVALGLGLLLFSRASFRVFRSEDPDRGLLVVGLAMVARLAMVTLTLWAYRTVAPAGFLPFALALVAGFLVSYTVELVRFAGLHRFARPKPGARIGGR